MTQVKLISFTRVKKGLKEKKSQTGSRKDGKFDWLGWMKKKEATAETNGT